MGQDFFTYLPPELIINILSRLPVRNTMSCKFVCKSWLDLLVTPEFVKSHLSKSIPGLTVFEWETQSKPYKIVEFVDELDLDCHKHRWNIAFNLDLPFNVPVRSSVNGLLFIYKGSYYCPVDLFLCNPITRDHVKLPCTRDSSSIPLRQTDTYGFGVSRMSGECKLVRISVKIKPHEPQVVKHDQFECQVYTVGTGSWRRIASTIPLEFAHSFVGAFVNGNLHWLASDLNFSARIACFDLETELFSTFSAPPLHGGDKYRAVSAFRDCLCVCDNSILGEMSDNQIVIWLLKEYEDEKSWTKEFIFHKMPYRQFIGFICPIKIFKGGDVLMDLETELLYYSNKTKTIRVVDASGLDGKAFSTATTYTPSFLPLKAFPMENVTSF